MKINILSCVNLLLYILNNIRKLYEDLIESNVLNEKEFKKILIDGYRVFII